MDNIEKVYNHIKTFVTENGFPPSARQVAEELKLDYETEVSPAIEELLAKRRIVIEKNKDCKVKPT